MLYGRINRIIAFLKEKFAEETESSKEMLITYSDYLKGEANDEDLEKAMEDKLGQIGSLMNYRMIGDSAAGIKMRRSKAYTSGAVNTGTGQLSRSMKLQTLNI